LLIFVTLACDLNVYLTPPSNTDPAPANTTVLIPEASTQAPASATTIPATLVPNVIPASPLPSSDGVPVFFKPISLVLPTGLASGISGSQIPRVDGPDRPAWELTPGHSVLKLEGYLLQGKFHQPQIYVYPASGYAELVPGAFESMHRLQNVINGSGSSINAEQLPAVPFFNAAQVFASNIQTISFQNGTGVRFLTEYAQYAAPVNNHELIYHFQGFTSDGGYYIIAVLPITVPVLADTSEAGAVLPSGGIGYPDITSSNPDFQGYYASVADLLNTTSPDAFSPKISQLDALIRSIQIMP
ncbi:MAG: hypothetical protein R3307_07925, partial [Anaerolineales bacterium]|nr:hypothetical protein [Anaerolineales bacterium]